MTVIDLIIQLQQMPQNMSVLFDKAPLGADDIEAVNVDHSEVIKTDNGLEFVLLSCDEPGYGFSNN